MTDLASPKTGLLLNTQADTAQQADGDLPVMKRLDTWDAFVILFSISFGPAFVAVDLTVN